MDLIPLKPVPSQQLSVTLGGQPVQLAVYQKMFGLHMDLAVSGVPIVTGALCLNMNPVVRSIYLNFIGDLLFFDEQGTNDPDFTGLGSRFDLFYVTPGDIA